MAVLPVAVLPVAVLPVAVRLEVDRLEVVRLEVDRLEVVRLEVARLEVVRLEVARLEVARLEVARLEVVRLEVVRLEVVRLEVVRLEVDRPGVVVHPLSFLHRLLGWTDHHLDLFSISPHRVGVGRVSVRSMPAAMTLARFQSRFQKLDRYFPLGFESPWRLRLSLEQPVLPIPGQQDRGSGRVVARVLVA